jgi:hypothetical protein
MSREQSMQRLNILTLAAFLVGLAAFVYDFATPAPARLVADAPQWNASPAKLMLDIPHDQMAHASGMEFSLD